MSNRLHINAFLGLDVSGRTNRRKRNTTLSSVDAHQITGQFVAPVTFAMHFITDILHWICFEKNISTTMNTDVYKTVRNENQAQ